MTVFDHSILKEDYDNDSSSIADDFLVPCLKKCQKYRRTTFSFSSGALKSWAGSFVHIIDKNVKIEILCDMSVACDRDEQLKIALSKYTKDRENQTALKEMHNKVLMAALAFDINPDNRDAREILLDWMLVNKQLELKFAYPKEDNLSSFDPIYHKKMGYFKYSDSEFIAFKGSWNETLAGSKFNGEECDVYSSEKTSDQNRCLRTIKRVDDDWDNNNERFHIMPLSKDVLDLISNRTPASIERIKQKLKLTKSIQCSDTKFIKKESQEIKLRQYQEDAIESWISNEYKGMLKFATGAGKTITALYAIKEHFKKHNICLIVVPSNLLQSQWLKEIKKYLPEVGRRVLKVGGGNSKWKADLTSFSKNNKDSEPKIILAIQNSASKDDFIDSINDGDHLMIVADEVHNLGSKQFSKIFKLKSGSRLGLSATPERYNDPDGTKKIFDYFGRELSPIIELKDVIGKALVNYDYFPTRCTLNETEVEEWNELTQKIRSLSWKNKKDENGKTNFSKEAEMLLFKRADIAKKASSKIYATEKILIENFQPSEQWLIYCDDIDQINQLREELVKKNIDTLIYHSEMHDKEKELTKKKFEEFGGILLSIRCLDEGVDIPSITHAIIIASDQNPRQFIQRRGRVLRRDPLNPNKNKAFIYDLVVAQDPGKFDSIKNLIKTEISRCIEFADSAQNKYTCKTRLQKIANVSNVNINNILYKDNFIDDDKINIED